MKFGKQLRFVAVKNWYDHYIPYKEVKKLINSFTTRVEEAKELGKSESEILQITEECYEIFKETLIDHVNASIKFFCSLLTESNEKIQKLREDINVEIEELADSEKTPELASSFYKRIFANLLNLYEVRSFLAINNTCCHASAKKFAKRLHYPQCVQEFNMIEETCFASQPTIDDNLLTLEECYIDIKRKIDEVPDKRPRQELIFELHKSVENTLLWKQTTVVQKWNAYTFRELEFHLPQQANIKWIPIIIAFICLIAFQVANFFPEGQFCAQRALGMLIFCAILWATTAVPLWLTSMSIPFIATVARLFPNTDIETIAKQIQVATMSNTIYLIIGGFTIAAAFKETEMDKRITSAILAKATGSVKLFLFAVIALNAFLAMWINNVASTMIVVTLVAPILDQLPSGSVFAKMVLLGIAAGGNFGGTMTPLASPQNAIAIQTYENAIERGGFKSSFGFVEFLATAFPTGAIGCVIFWGLLILIFKPDITQVPQFQPSNTDFGWRQIVVTITTIITIIIWIVLPFGAESIFGDSGAVGFIPFIVFYGCGILPASRLAALPWNIIFLMFGGNALGKAVDMSGLLTLISTALRNGIGGTSLWVSLFILNLVILIINIFVSHTVSATILLPIVADFALHSPHLRLYILQGALSITASQILPVSSFPNLCCISLQDRNGKEYLKTLDVVKTGSIATAVLFVLVFSLHYGISIAYGL